MEGPAVWPSVLCVASIYIYSYLNVLEELPFLQYFVMRFSS